MPWSSPVVFAARAVTPAWVPGPTTATCSAVADGEPTRLLPSVSTSPESPVDSVVVAAITGPLGTCDAGVTVGAPANGRGPAKLSDAIGPVRSGATDAVGSKMSRFRAGPWPTPLSKTASAE